MSWERYGGLRAAIAQLAAQIMYGEDVKQYFTAKRLAAKRLLGQVNAKTLRYRPRDLPSNGEIKQALLELVVEIEGDQRVRRLFAMRIVALEAMEALTPFLPRLIGSVATGHVRSGSDIDLHVFAWDSADVEAHVRGLGWAYELERVSILKHGKVMNFTHVHVADVFPLELTVYAPNELSHRPRSSTDGKPIVRIRPQALRKICEREHAELWARYLADGTTPTLGEILEDEEGDEGDFETGAPHLGERDDREALEEEARANAVLFAPEEDEPAAQEHDSDDDMPEREPRIRRPRSPRRRSDEARRARKMTGETYSLPE
jgi:hypothetical protein